MPSTSPPDQRINNHMNNTTDPHGYDQDSPQEVITRLSDSNDLVDIMISIENYLDTNDVYTFKNWIEGEIVSGPYVKKYWVKVTLKWDYKDMPDPDGGLRLLKHGTKIRFRKSTEEVPVEVKSEADYQPGTKKPKMKKVKIWLVDMLIPRRFVESISKEVMDLYDEEVDTDTADEAVSQGATADQAVQA
jgi:hypothetical protein